MKQNSFAQKWTPKAILKFTIPSIVMMIITSLYTIVDGIFVSRLVNSDALSAVNIVLPFTSLSYAVSIMLASGGSAIIARKMGEGNKDKARKDFSLITFVGLIFGIFLLIFSLIFMKPILAFLGSTPQLASYTHDYFFFLILFTPFSVLQIFASYFFITAGKPHHSLGLSISGGLCNILLDYILIKHCNLGIKGAAIGTGFSYLIPSIFFLIYFFINKKGSLYFVHTKWNKNMLIKCCTNGSSEMVSNLAMGVTTFLYNLVMLHFLGEDGVAAITIILYVQFLQASIFLGYSQGIAPVFSYSYGANKIKQTKRLFKFSLLFILVCSVLIMLLSILGSGLIIKTFVDESNQVYDIARHGFVIFSIAFLFMGINIFASALFTAFGNGKVSAFISVLRTFVFLSIFILGFAYLFGIEGIWFSIPVAELLTLIIVVLCLKRYKNTYNY